MKKIIVVLALALVATLGLSVPTASEAAVPPRETVVPTSLAVHQEAQLGIASTSTSFGCIQMEPIEMRHHRRILEVAGHRATINWKWCWTFGNANHSWVQLRNAYVRYDVAGLWEPCGILDAFDGTTFSFSVNNPYTGFWWHSKEVRVPCHTSTKGSALIDLRGAPPIYYKGGRCNQFTFPKGYVTAQDHLSFPEPDQHELMGPRRFYHPGWPCQ